MPSSYIPENEKLKDCPLLQSGTGRVYCKEARCAWWSDKTNQCAILITAEKLHDLYKHGIKTKT